MEALFQRRWRPAWLAEWRSHRSQWIAAVAVAVLLGAGGAALQQRGPKPAPASHAEPIPAAEFSRLIRDFSEEGGYFFSDNFTSNESAYLYILKPLRQHGSTGGAYLGVGPEQNFTYIAHLRPAIAFIVDIRRQAIVQHLMYKAIFHMAPDRARFLSTLFSKPLADANAFPNDADIAEILKYVSQAASSEQEYRAHLARIERMIQQDFQVPLSASDRRDLAYVFHAFYRGNVNISFRMAGDSYGGYWGARFPNLADLILATDGEGRRGNFLASQESYEVVRRLQMQNRVIPVVGDFGGKKALASVAGYLRRNGYTLTAFYTSNVEQYLFSSGSFPEFAANVRKMPINEKSVIIRAVRARGRMHPGYIPGHRMAPLLVFVSVFNADYEEGLYPDYWSLISTHYLSGNEP